MLHVYERTVYALWAHGCVKLAARAPGRAISPLALALFFLSLSSCVHYSFLPFVLSLSLSLSLSSPFSVSLNFDGGGIALEKRDGGGGSKSDA